MCEHSGKSGKSGGGGSGKSGKSGGSKSGGRKLDVSSYEGSSDSSSKSGKSSSGGGGGSKGSKSSSYGSAPSACSTYSHSSKSGKSDDGGSKSSKSDGGGSKSSKSSSYSASKGGCVCEEQDWVVAGPTCIQTCESIAVTPGGPYGSSDECCMANMCISIVECGDSNIIAPAPTPPDFVGTPFPTIGDTTTVATEAEIEFAEQTGDRPPN